MPLNIEAEISLLQQMTVSQLQDKFAEVFGEATSGRHKQWLLKRIAWRIQANHYGGLSEHVAQRAKELANSADLRLLPPKTEAARMPETVELPETDSTRDPRLPAAGTILRRVYKGTEHRVAVQHDYFVYQGKHYRSLTAIAEVITGGHWNGYRFFKLTNKEAGQ